MAEDTAGFNEAKQLGLDPVAFVDALPLWHNEVGMLLGNRLTEIRQEAAASGDGGSGMVDLDMLTKTLDICRKLNCFSDSHAGNVDLAKEALARDGKMTIFEQTLINNLLITEVDECLELIPSLRPKYNTDELKEELRLTLEQVDNYQNGGALTSSVGGLQVTKPEDIDLDSLQSDSQFFGNNEGPKAELRADVARVFIPSPDRQASSAVKNELAASDDLHLTGEPLLQSTQPQMDVDHSFNQSSLDSSAVQSADIADDTPRVKQEPSDDQLSP